jgi:thioesterase domain-containing protein
MEVRSLKASVNDTARTLVTVQPGSTGPPVYCFHPLGGSVAIYGTLAQRLGSDRQVYGLQSVGLAGGQDPDTTVIAMAGRYAAEIESGSPSAAAVYVGYSMGGVLALETARQMALATGEAPHIVIIDCDPVYSSPPDTGPWHVLVRQVFDLDLPLPPLSDLAEADALAVIRRAASERGRLPPRFELERLARMARVCRLNERAAAEHVPAYFDGTVHVVRSERDAVVPGADIWDGFVRQAVLRYAPADHYSLMTPDDLSYVAALITELIDGE